MDVFLVPVDRDAYELYCEHVDEPEAPEPEPPPAIGLFARGKAWIYGFFRSLKARFHAVLVEAERERRREVVARPEGSLTARVKRRCMRWLAESIAEQRLLWNLRRHVEATLHHPHDMSGDASLDLMRRQLARDFDKHRFWLAIDSVLMVVSGLLILVPGPNIIGYYFAFRVVGHFFSLRGARNGLNKVAWTTVASAPLSDLRFALSLDAAGRLRQAEEVALRLQLDHLATFFQRTAVS